jgi:hypothetical protein
VVTLPTARARPAADPDDQIGGVVKPGSAVEGALKSLLAADPNFHAREFVDGARLAYEMIVTAFASGDKSTLSRCLDEEVYEGFVKAIDDRNAAGETVDFTLLAWTSPTSLKLNWLDQIAQITMRFKSQLISVTKDSDGRVIDGDPTEVTEMTDIWTFARDRQRRSQLEAGRHRSDLSGPRFAMRWAVRHQTRLHGALGLAWPSVCYQGPSWPIAFQRLWFQPVSFDALDGWASDDHAAALAAFTRTCERARVHPPRTRPSGVDGEALRSVCAQLRDNPDPEARTFFEQHFVPYHGEGAGFADRLFRAAA